MTMISRLTQCAGKMSAACMMTAVVSKVAEVNQERISEWKQKLPNFTSAYKVLAPLSAMFGALSATSSKRGWVKLGAVCATGVASHLFVKNLLSNPAKYFGR